MKKNTLSSWFRNRLIRRKIIIVYIPLILIPLLLLGYVSNNFYKESIVKHTSNNVESNSQLIITRIEGMIKNAESSANMLTLNLNKIFDSELTAHKLYTEITNQLSYSLLIFPEIDSAVFIDTEGRIYGSSPALERNPIPFSARAWMERIEQSSGNNIWFPMQKREYLVADSNMPVLSLGKRIVNINTGSKLGSLIVNIRESSFSDLYNALGSYSEVGKYSIVDDSGTIISSARKAELLLPWSGEAENDEHVLLSRTPFNRMNWQLLSEIPIKELTKDSRRVTDTIVIVGAICLLVALAGAAYLSKVIATPIITLTRGMRKVREGNLDHRIAVQSSDETGLLASGFNEMLSRIQELLATVKYEQYKKREYELALIQSQIKPHFLYNTLDVIYALAEMKRIQDVQKTTKALADFYRVVLSGGREIIPLEQEVGNVKDYLRIQRIRYSDVFDYSIELSPEIRQFHVLKLTIQPLVENAIYHGLKEKDSFGYLRIEAYSEGDLIKIKVSDNGAGMSEEKLHEIQELLRASKPHSSYGLWSVNDRIQLYFGEQYGLQLKSKLGEGTEVIIAMPKDWEEKKTDAEDYDRG